MISWTKYRGQKETCKAYYARGFLGGLVREVESLNIF